MASYGRSTNRIDADADARTAALTRGRRLRRLTAADLQQMFSQKISSKATGQKYNQQNNQTSVWAMMNCRIVL